MSETAHAPEIGQDIYVSANGRSIHTDPKCSISVNSWHTDSHLTIAFNERWDAALAKGRVHLCKKCW